jgi:lysozyme family protein
VTDAFDAAIADLLGIEGGFSDDPADSGGATRYGITEAVARRHGYTGPMREMPSDLARAIYRADYWDAQQLDSVALLSRPIAFELFDTGINMGTSRAGEFLQMSLNAFNRQASDYEDIEVDGEIGTRTLEALAAFLAQRKRDGEIVLLRALNALQGAAYVDLAERRAKDERFVFGWFLQRVRI